MIASLFSILVLTVAASQQGPTPFSAKPITLEIRGKLLGPALEQLSEATGLKLLPSPKLAGEPVILRVHQKPTSEVLSLLARVLEAEWRSEPAGWRLVRTLELERECDRRRDAIQAGKIAKFQEDLRAALDKLPTFDQSAAASLKSSLEALTQSALTNDDSALALQNRRDALHFQSPLIWLCRSLLANIDPIQIASLRPYSRIVFAERQNPIQTAMPKELRPFLIEFYSMWERWVEAIRPVSEFYVSQGMKPENLGLPRLVQTPNAKLLFTINRPDYYNSGYAEALLVNNEGAVLERALVNISGVNPPALNRAKDPSESPSVEPIEVSLLGQECVKVGESRRNSAPAFAYKSLSPGLRQLLSQPETRDLAEALMSDLILGRAKADRIDVIAAPSWQAPLLSPYTLARGPMSAEGFDRQLGTRWFAIQTRPQPNWLLIEPVAPQTNYREGGLRRTLGPIARKVIDGGRPSLDELAAYAVTNQSWGSIAHLTSLVSFIEAWADFEIPHGFELDFLKLHGTLTPMQHGDLGSGAQLPLSAIQSSARELVGHYALQSGSNLRRGTPNSKAQTKTNPNKDAPEPFERIQYYEPSEVFRAGIPPTSLLSRTSKEVFEFDLCSRRKVNGLGNRTSQDLAWEVLNPSRQFEYINYEPGDSMIRARRWREYTYLVEFGSDFYVEVSLKDVVEATPWVGIWEQLPARYVRAIRAAIEEEKKRPRGVEVGGTIPPK
ncbi:MAG: hypothetical protein HZC36_07125 [Armatimonadetes bacterium]|nr:hypothetical protein [Armatimonadota bacterium]